MFIWMWERSTAEAPAFWFYSHRRSTRVREHGPPAGIRCSVRTETKIETGRQLLDNLLFFFLIARLSRVLIKDKAYLFVFFFSSHGWPRRKSESASIREPSGTNPGPATGNTQVLGSFCRSASVGCYSLKLTAVPGDINTYLTLVLFESKRSARI